MKMGYNTRLTKYKPYFYKGHVRIFNKDLSTNDLKWHRDKRTRFIRILSSKGWFLQKDNKVPVELKVNKIYKVKAGEYHRLINKNISELKITIFEI